MHTKLPVVQFSVMDVSLATTLILEDKNANQSSLLLLTIYITPHTYGMSNIMFNSFRLEEYFYTSVLPKPLETLGNE